jgi:hypothetical protein
MTLEHLPFQIFRPKLRNYHTKVAVLVLLHQVSESMSWATAQNSKLILLMR